MMSLRSISRSLGSTADRFSPSTVSVDSPRSTIVLVSVVAIVSYVAPKIESTLMLNLQAAWPLWPGCAILVAALMLVRTRIWTILIPTSFAEFVLSDLQAGVPVTSIAWFIPADTIQVLTAGIGLRYCFQGVPRLNNINSLAKYCFLAVFLAPFVAAFVSAPGIPGNYWTSWKISFLSEVLAFITLAPAILSWVTEGPAWAQKTSAYHREFAVLVVATVVLSYLIFGTSNMGESPAVLYALVPFLLWSALRFGSIGITSSMMIIGLLSVWGVVHGQGPFRAPGTASSIMLLQLFLIFASVPFMVLTALVEDRKIAGERLASRLIDAQEKERTRIARELHDDINQRLAFLVIELEEVKKDYPLLPAEIRSRIEKLRAHTMELSGDVETLSHQLHSSKLEYLGLVSAMRGWCREFGDKNNIEIEFRSHDLLALPSQEISLSLFRVLQEALSNAAKYSGAKRVEVELAERSGQLDLEIKDSGRGFDLQNVIQGAGLGLMSIQERLRLVNGRVTIHSKPMGGTTIHARVPCKNKRKSQRAAG